MAAETMGEFMVRRGFLTYEQVHEIIREQQRKPKKLFGQLAISLGYLDDEVINLYFKEKKEF